MPGESMIVYYLIYTKTAAIHTYDHYLRLLDLEEWMGTNNINPACMFGINRCFTKEDAFLIKLQFGDIIDLKQHNTEWDEQ